MLIRDGLVRDQLGVERNGLVRQRVRVRGTVGTLSSSCLTHSRSRAFDRPTSAAHPSDPWLVLLVRVSLITNRRPHGLCCTPSPSAAMRFPCSSALILPALAAAAASVAAGPSSPDSRSLERLPRSEHLVPRDGDHGHGGHGGHSHHAQPLLELNDTEFIMAHGPTPPSYFWLDLKEPPADEKRYPGLMGLHALCMSMAFFVALPTGAFLRVLGPVTASDAQTTRYRAPVC